MIMVAQAYEHVPVPSTSETSSLPFSGTERNGNNGARINGRPKALMPAPGTPSKPMVIPTRTKRRAKKMQESQSQERARKARILPDDHNPESLPPSAEAFLAMTAIPEHGRGMLSASQKRYTETSSTRVGQQQVLRRSVSSTSPQSWDLLLSPPESDECESSSYESETTLGPSSISTASVPSLAEDEGSVSSTSIPATPGQSSSGRAGKRSKSLSASFGENCILNHPLLYQAKTGSVVPSNIDPEAISQDGDPKQTFKASFKSNLTASLRAIRSATRTISNMAPPIREDLLSRSILSFDSPFADERRPMATLDIPDPAVRRYLNPSHLAPAELHSHSHLEQSDCKSAVQMQSYRPGARKSPHATSPPIFVASEPKQKAFHLSKNALDTEDPLTSSLLPKQREPRENGDFLRVIVLEMNMRKVGKLSDTSPGRAKLWLPARPVPKPDTDNTPLCGDGHKYVRYGTNGQVGRVSSRLEEVLRNT